MHTAGAPTSADHIAENVTVDPITDPDGSTFIDDELIATETPVTSQHLHGVPPAYIVTLPTFSPTTYGLALLASRQYMWTCYIPETSIPTTIPDILCKPLLTKIPTVTRTSANQVSLHIDTYTVHCS